jgi:hypothetical protein
MGRRHPLLACAPLALLVLALGGPLRTASAGPETRTAEDELAQRLLDAPLAHRVALEEAVGTRGEAGRAALERARRGPEPQRAWLAEAYATRAATRGSDLPEVRRAFERATRVVRVLTVTEVKEPWAREEHATRRTADAVAMLKDGDVRALPWVEHFADDAAAPGPARFEAARALVLAKSPGAVARLERVLEEAHGFDKPNELIDEVAAIGAAEAVPFLVRARAGAARMGDGAAPDRAARALEALRNVPGFAEAYERPLERLKRYEAESEPLLHSTGQAVEGGWQAKRGRDGVQHMVYGPYVRDLEGRWHFARFRFRIDDAGDARERPALQLEVTSQQMERMGVPIQKLAVFTGAGGVGEWQEKDLVFWPHPDHAHMEFRVYWPGNCDATVDRIDLLGARKRNDADRALDPARAPLPWSPAPSPAPLTTAACVALLDAALRLPTRADAQRPAGATERTSEQPPPGPWKTLRDVLLAEPAAHEALHAAVKGDAGPDRAWLALTWLALRSSPQRWEDLRAELDRALVPALSSQSRPRPHEVRLANGTMAVAIEGIEPDAGATGVEWLRWQPPARIPPLVDPPPISHRLNPSPLWGAIFAEEWLLGWRGPLPPTQPGGSPGMVVPSSVGVRRFHALQQLAWLGEARVVPALRALAADAAATPAERAVAARLLAHVPP